MSDRSEVMRKRIVVTHAGAVRVGPDVEYGRNGNEALTMDVYDSSDESSIGTVVILQGYPDPGFRSFFGIPFKESGWAMSWAELLASNGMTAVTYTNVDPLDVHALLLHLRDSSPSPIALLACSGHGALAMSLLRADRPVRIACAALLYPFTIDTAGSTAVADAAKQFRFSAPPVTIEDLRDDVPLLLGRAGRDEMPRLNEALDSFAFAALRKNLPIEIVNHPAAPHAFDLSDDSATTHRIVGRTIGFLREGLTWRA